MAGQDFESPDEKPGASPGATSPRLWTRLRVRLFALALLAIIPCAHLFVLNAAHQKRNLLGLLLASGLALFAAWFAGGIIRMRPVRALMKMARSIEAGDFSARTQLDYRDGKLGRLAFAFDEMAESLQRRDDPQHESEGARFDLENRLNALVMGATDAMIVFDEETGITPFNRRAEALLGYGKSELIGLPFARLLAGESSGPPPKGGAEPFHAVLRRKDGGTLRTTLSLSPVEEEGRTLHLAIFRPMEGETV